MLINIKPLKLKAEEAQSISINVYGNTLYHQLFISIVSKSAVKIMGVIRGQYEQSLTGSYSEAEQCAVYRMWPFFFKN